MTSDSFKIHRKVVRVCGFCGQCCASIIYRPEDEHSWVTKKSIYCISTCFMLKDHAISNCIVDFDFDSIGKNMLDLDDENKYTLSLMITIILTRCLNNDCVQYIACLKFEL
jgi:hypothetical protein